MKFTQGQLHVRDKRVILDADLAALYGLQTRALVQAFKRNIDRFPEDFQFQLTPAELEALRSEIVISKPGREKHRKYPPYAFTEHGALMAATVLNSQRAEAFGPHNLALPLSALRRSMGTRLRFRQG